MGLLNTKDDIIELAPGSTTKVCIGQIISITMEENPYSSYKWNYMISHPKRVRLLDKKACMPSITTNEILGVRQNISWQFEVLEDGIIDIIFYQLKPWDNINNAINSIKYYLNV